MTDVGTIDAGVGTDTGAMIGANLNGSAVPDPSGRLLRPEQKEVRRSTAGFRATDLYAILGAIVGALSTTILLFQLLPFSGAVGFVVVSYVLFLGSYALLVSMDERGPIVRDRVASVVVHSLAFLLVSALALIVLYTLSRGAEAMRQFTNFYTEDMSQTGPLDPISSGGIKHAVVGTLIMITIALAIVVPLGITCAVFLNEVPGKFARFVRTIAEAMTALPSIIAGLFIYATFILILGFPKSGLAAALAISVMMLPIIIRAADVVLRLVPGSLKEASLALGTGQWRTVWHVTLPTARSGLATAVILGTARGIGETSPVLLTAGFTASLNVDPTQGPMISLPLAVFEFVKSPEPNQIARGFAAAGTLLVLVLLLFIVARIIGGRGPGNLTKRQRRRRAAQSAADLERFSTRAAAVVTPTGKHRAP